MSPMTTASQSAVTDPLRMPESIARLPWYQDLLADAADFDLERGRLVEQMTALQSRAEGLRRRGSAPPEQDRRDFVAVNGAIRRIDLLAREHAAVMRNALEEHYDEVARLIADAQADVERQASSILASIVEPLGAAADAYNAVLRVKRELRRQINGPTTRWDRPAPIPQPGEDVDGLGLLALVGDAHP